MTAIYNPSYRGECRSERCEQIDCMGWIEKNHPDRWTLIFHCPSETKGKPQHMQMRAKEGVKPGIPDIIDTNGPICGFFELKRLDSTKSRPSKDQLAFLERASSAGHFTAICYGFESFKQAYGDYLRFCACR